MEDEDDLDDELCAQIDNLVAQHNRSKVPRRDACALALGRTCSSGALGCPARRAVPERRQRRWPPRARTAASTEAPRRPAPCRWRLQLLCRWGTPIRQRGERPRPRQRRTCRSSSTPSSTTSSTTSTRSSPTPPSARRLPSSRPQQTPGPRPQPRCSRPSPPPPATTTRRTSTQQGRRPGPPQHRAQRGHSPSRRSRAQRQSPSRQPRAPRLPASGEGEMLAASQ